MPFRPRMPSAPYANTREKVSNLKSEPQIPWAAERPAADTCLPPHQCQTSSPSVSPASERAGGTWGLYVGSRIRQTGSGSSPALWPLTASQTAVCLSFLIWEVGVMAALTCLLLVGGGHLKSPQGRAQHTAGAQKTVALRHLITSILLYYSLHMMM